MRGLKQAPGDMNALFTSMLARANPAYKKRPKHFLRYIMVGENMRAETRLSELLFTECDQDELDMCLQDGFTEAFVRRLAESASTIEQKVLAHCAGLVHVVDLNEDNVDDDFVDNQTSLATTTYNGDPGGEGSMHSARSQSPIENEESNDDDNHSDNPYDITSGSFGLVEAGINESSTQDQQGDDLRANFDNISRKTSSIESERSPEVCRTRYKGPKVVDLDMAVLKKSIKKVEFIHRTAADFLRDDPAGQKFVGACTSPEITLTLLRANVARTALGVDHPGLGCHGEAYLPGHIEKISRLCATIGSLPTTNEHSHTLIDRFLTQLILDFGHTEQTPTIRGRNMRQLINGNWWPIEPALGISFRLAYCCRHSLFSYAATYVQTLPSDIRQSANILMTLAAIEAKQTAGLQAYFAADQLIFESEVPAIWFPSRIWYPSRRYVLAYQKVPLWKTLARILANTWVSVGPGELASTVSNVVQVMRSLRGDSCPSTEFFKLEINAAWSEPRTFRFMQDGVSEHKGHGGLIHSSRLVLECTLDSLISLILPGIGIPEWGLSGVGPLPRPTHWSPDGFDRFLALREGLTPELWVFRHNRYELDRKSIIELAEEQLAQLNASELRALRLRHSEKSGRLQIWPTEL
jgi:hypothetical protein